MTYKVDVHLALYRNTEIECYPSVIAVLNWLFVRFEFSACEFSCCDYKASCQSHMRQHVKNVHEGFKYDCTSCNKNSGDKGNLN